MSDKFYLGIDAGTESIRASIFSFNGHMISTESVAYTTAFPKNGHVEQNPSDWWECLGRCIRNLTEKSHIDAALIGAISVDATCCSVVALDSSGCPLRPCLLWMDARSAECAADIMRLGKGNRALDINCGGEGPLSAEWMLPKALWLKRNEPDTWTNATYICEKLDFINYHLTGIMVASACNVAARWHIDARKAMGTSSIYSEQKNSRNGRPTSLLEKIELLDILTKWPQTILAMGDPIGRLTEEAAKHLGLHTSTVVVQGGPDAYVAMVGVGCVHTGDIAVITGSSHLHLRIVPDEEILDDSTPSAEMEKFIAEPDRSSSLVVEDGCEGRCGVAVYRQEVEEEASKKVDRGVGYWGPYIGAPLANTCFTEGGQSSTGSMVSWMRSLISGPIMQQLNTGGDGGRECERRLLEYSELDDSAAEVAVGAEGLLVLETLQGARTPNTDPLQRGSLVGLSLSHTRAHIWRAVLESVCYGTRACLEALIDTDLSRVDQAIADTTIYLTGGAARSPMWLQMHSDVTGLRVQTGSEVGGGNASLVGCAVLARVGLAKYLHSMSGGGSCPLVSIDQAVSEMVHPGVMIEPDQEKHKQYNSVYRRYLMLAPALRSVFHAAQSLGNDGDDK